MPLFLHFQTTPPALISPPYAPLVQRLHLFRSPIREASEIRSLGHAVQGPALLLWYLFFQGLESALPPHPRNFSTYDQNQGPQHLHAGKPRPGHFCIPGGLTELYRVSPNFPALLYHQLKLLTFSPFTLRSAVLYSTGRRV